MINTPKDVEIVSLKDWKFSDALAIYDPVTNKIQSLSAEDMFKVVIDHERNHQERRGRITLWINSFCHPHNITILVLLFFASFMFHSNVFMTIFALAILIMGISYIYEEHYQSSKRMQRMMECASESSET